MRCVVCKHGETQPGTTTLTLERGNTTLVIKGIPALVCENCGEAYIEDTVTRHLLAVADDAVKNGVLVDVREFVAA